MNRTLVLGLLIYTLVFGAIITLQGGLLLLALPLVLYLGVSLLTRPDGPQLEITRHLSAARIQQQEPVTVELTVVNRGGAIESLLLEDIIPTGLSVADGHATILTALPAGASTTLSYQLVGRRGVYRLAGMRAKATDRFGLSTRAAEFETEGRLFVMPEVQKLPSVTVRPPRTRVFAGPVLARKGGPGIEFYGVRPYQPGDALHWINQRASARYDNEVHAGALYVNEFEQERAADVGLILDVRRETNLFAGNRSLLEHSVAATAAMADAFLDIGNRVGLFIYGGGLDWTHPGYGKYQRERILQALARVRLQEHQVFKDLGNLPTQLFPIRSQLVIISPLRLADGDNMVALRARGYQLLAVVPDPVAFERRDLDDSESADLAARVIRLQRSQLFQQMQQAGVQVFDWDVSVPFAAAAQGELNRPPRWNRGPGGI